jgi:hypothetical protein
MVLALDHEEKFRFLPVEPIVLPEEEEPEPSDSDFFDIDFDDFLDLFGISSEESESDGFFDCWFGCSSEEEEDLSEEEGDVGYA